MASKAPPPPSSRQPAGVPSSGGAKYAVAAVALLGLIGTAVAWKTCQKPPEPTILYVDAAPPPTFTGRNPDDDVPPPPPIEDAGPASGKKAVVTQGSNYQCDAKKCSGSNSSELETALQFRVKQAHRCYDNALAQDPTLRGKVTVAVRVGSNGQVCSAGIAANEMSSQQVATCVSGYFRGANFPAPKGGCVDVNIPINFVPRQ
jgi:outer membrane biosynthesis protein TonB